MKKFNFEKKTELLYIGLVPLKQGEAVIILVTSVVVAEGRESEPTNANGCTKRITKKC